MQNNPIEITLSALAHLKKQRDNKHLRLAVEQGGCSGLSYVIAMVDKPEESDLTFSLEPGFSLFIAKDSLVYLKDMQIDFVKKGFNGQLQFVNPNAKHTCGCGESFGT